MSEPTLRPGSIRLRAVLHTAVLLVIASIPSNLLAETPPASVEEARSSSIRAFERTVRAKYESHLERAGAEPTPDPPAPEGGGVSEAEDATGEEEEPGRLRLQSVLDHLSVSAGWQVEQEHWQAGIRLRYARSVEFDPETATFALIESTELSPAGRWWALIASRTTRTVVRRTGYPTWDKALFAAPSRWAFFDRPNLLEEARRVEPGTEITASNESKIFVGIDASTDLGKYPVRFRAGPFRSAEFFVRMKRLPKQLVARGNREWVLSVGGEVPNGIDLAVDLRTPELLLGKRFRLFKTSWKVQSGVRFLFRAGPLDLDAIPDAERFFAEAVAGGAIFRFRDLDLLGMGLRKSKPIEQRFDVLEQLEEWSGFRGILGAASRSPVAVPWSKALSHFESRPSGEFNIGARILVYGVDFTASTSSAESLGTRSSGAPYTIFEFPFQRRSDRGWLLFPRETHDLRMVTVMDSASDDAFTEVSFELNDARAHSAERQKYGDRIASFLTRSVADPLSRIPAEAFQESTQLQDVLPDFRGVSDEDQNVSIYLRMILGPEFHDQLLGPAFRDRFRARTMDPKELAARTTEWQRGLGAAVRHPRGELDRLIAAFGMEQFYVSYRIAVTPRGEKPRPTILYTGAFGDPRKIPSYTRLRKAFDEAGTGF